MCCCASAASRRTWAVGPCPAAPRTSAKPARKPLGGNCMEECGLTVGDAAFLRPCRHHPPRRRRTGAVPLHHPRFRRPLGRRRAGRRDRRHRRGLGAAGRAGTIWPLVRGAPDHRDRPAPGRLVSRMIARVIAGWVRSRQSHGKSRTPRASRDRASGLADPSTASCRLNAATPGSTVCAGWRRCRWRWATASSRSPAWRSGAPACGTFRRCRGRISACACCPRCFPAMPRSWCSSCSAAMCCGARSSASSAVLLPGLPDYACARIYRLYPPGHRQRPAARPADRRACRRASAQHAAAEQQPEQRAVVAAGGGDRELRALRASGG